MSLKKTIYINMLILAFFSVILASGLLIFTFYSSFTEQIKSELKDKSIFLENSLNLVDDKIKYMEELNISSKELRTTVVDIDGTVLYDNTIDIKTLGNHKDREEIKKAFEFGAGESKRFSQTIGKQTYYYAVKLSDGIVLRVAKTTSSIYGIFVSILPQCIVLILIILFLCLFIAKRLTRKIIEPINKFNFDQNSNTYDELSPFIREITSQKRQIQSALNEVTKKSDIIEAISDNMKEGLILTDKDGIVLLANKSALSILNIADGSSGRNILELTRVIQVLDHIKLALNGENNDMILPIDEKNYHVFFSNVDKGVLILFLDVTEKAKSEKMRREFSANVSHELKTPLTTISGFAELMSKGMVMPDDITDVAKRIKKESERLIVLIEDIIRLSELDESDGERVYEQFDLTKLIGEVIDNLKVKADEAMLTFCIPDKKYDIIANKPMVYEMLYNIVENAIKYNKPGGKVSVIAENIGEKTKISIIDTGIGIDKKHHNRIFERFYRVDKSRSKKIGGTGLGLSIVKHIAAYHNGTVKVKSEPGRGTEIIIELANLGY